MPRREKRCKPAILSSIGASGTGEYSFSAVRVLSLSKHYARWSHVCLPISGYLRRLAPSYLTTILELLLTNLVSLSLSHEAASVVELCSALDGHDVSRDVCRQVMAWFGEVADGKWKVNVAAAVKEVGLGILRAYKVNHSIILTYTSF